MNEKQQQLLFDKGITNVPSDALCSDNALSYSHDLVYDNGEHKVIQNPIRFFNEGTLSLLYIHKFANQERYIVYTPAQGGYVLQWGIKNGTDFVNKGTLTGATYYSGINITSVGKTLIVTSTSGLMYYLWKGDTYKALGAIPVQDVKFYLNDDNASDYAVVNQGSTAGIDYEEHYVIPEDYDQWNDLVLGLYAKNKRAVANKKGFCLPFLVRTALRLYDDSYIYISQPVMLFPSISRNSYIDDHLLEGGTMQMWTMYKRLYYENKSYTDIGGERKFFYEDWTDIVKDIVIFITDGVEINDLMVDQPKGPFFTNVIHSVDSIDGIYSKPGHNMEYITKTPAPSGYIILKSKDTFDVESELTSRSVFYKLCSIGVFEVSDQSVSSKIGSHQLENLTTQEQLEYDDYFSRSLMVPQNIYSYNSRLNISNVSRALFEGFGYFLPFRIVADGAYIQPGIDPAYDRRLRFYVTIKTDEGDKIVCHEQNDPEGYYNDYVQGIYFYYPDSRATHVEIFRHHKTLDKFHRILNEDLKEHEGLNGAYYFKGIPRNTDHENYNTTAVEPTVNATPEMLANYIITSEVNNPWVFKAEGYNKVGTGKIIGMSTITQALSQGQFGQYPLLVFSENGIWAMSVNSTGLFQNIQPMSREVCIDGRSITQTDGAVFFVSEKGLMVVVGGDVKCVSEQMSGKNDVFPSRYLNMPSIDFKQVLNSCKIAYDYRDSLLWVFGSSNMCYIYAIKNGTFSLKTTAPIERVLNNYPDTLIQYNTGEVVSLMNRPNINNDSRTYEGRIISRPIKLENALALKSIMQIRNIYEMEGSVKLRIFASNNFNNWVELHSLRGTPWKYYRFAYQFENMKATDRFAGAVLITQERRTNKLR